MSTLETTAFVCAIGFVSAALVLHLLAVRTKAASRRYFTWAIAAVATAAVLLTVSLGVRAVQTGHGPFTNMYEFTVAFGWGVLVVLLIFMRSYRLSGVSIGGLFVAAALLLAAYGMPSRPVPLVPALQNSLLLSLHVAAAIFAYGAFAIAFVAALLLVLKTSSPKGEPEEDTATLEEISYRAAAVGFPFMTLVIVLGALWADVAWGRYWGWDPKETASLVSWLIYAAYLHARVLRGWHGRRAALLLVVGFVAVLLTFFGNYVFQSLHAYQ